MRRSTRADSRSTTPAALAAIAGAAIAGLLVLPAGARAEHGALSQRAGKKGCISDGGSESCRDGDLLFGAFAVALSRDGNNAYVASADAGGVASLVREQRTGALRAIPAPEGCISKDGTGGLCQTGRGIEAPISIAISPDGRNVYVASQQADPVTISALSAFSRDPETGVLSQLPDAQGCFSEDIPAPVCTPGIGLRRASSVAVSPDGRNVYVAAHATDSVAVFARNPDTGSLTQLPEPLGCMSQSGSSGHCTKSKALDGASSLALSKDGRFVYVASELSRAIAVFSRKRDTGALMQLPGEDGCIAQDGGEEMCGQGVGLAGPTAIAVSPDRRSVFAVSMIMNELAVLTRDRKTGKLSSVQCLTDDGSMACDPAVAFRAPFALAVSPDSRQVYVAVRQDHAVAVFSRDKRSRSLTQLPAPNGCVSQDGSEGLCTQVRALDNPRSVTLSPNGRQLYVAAQTSAAIAILQRRR